MSRQHTYDYLISHGVKPSVQRVAVMEYLMLNHTHPSAEEILSGLRESMPSISRMTVYNTLNILAESGAILALDIDPKIRHFDGDTSLHAHFMCCECATIYDINIEQFKSKLNIAPQGFTVTDTQLLLKGVCEKCKTKEKNRDYNS